MRDSFYTRPVHLALYKRTDLLTSWSPQPTNDNSSMSTRSATVHGYGNVRKIFISCQKDLHLVDDVAASKVIHVFTYPFVFGKMVKCCE